MNPLIETLAQYPLQLPPLFQSPLVLPDLLTPAAPWLAPGSRMWGRARTIGLGRIGLALASCRGIRGRR